MLKTCPRPTNNRCHDFFCMLQEFQLQPMVHKAKAGEAPPSSVKTMSDTADSSMTSSIASTSPQLQHSSPVGNGNAKGDMCLLYVWTVRADNFGNMT